MFQPISQEFPRDLAAIARQLMPDTDLYWSYVSKLAEAEGNLQLFRPIGWLEKAAIWKEYKLAISSLALGLRNAQCAGFGDEIATRLGAALKMLHALAHTDDPRERAAISNVARATVNEVIFQIDSQKLCNGMAQRWTFEELCNSFEWAEAATLEVWRAGRDLALSQFFTTLSFLGNRYGAVLGEVDDRYFCNYFLRTDREEDYWDAMGKAMMLIVCNDADGANLARIAEECGVTGAIVEYRSPLALVQLRKPDIGDEVDQQWSPW